MPARMGLPLSHRTWVSLVNSIAGDGTTRGLAGVPECHTCHTSAAARTSGRGRGRPGGVVAIQLYGMYLAVLSARRAAEEAVRSGGGGSTCSSSSSTAWSFGPAGFDPRGRPQGLFLGGVPAAPPGRGGGRKRLCARSTRGQWSGSAAPSNNGGGRQAGTVPPVPHPPQATMRAMSAGAAGSSAMLRTGSGGAPSGSGGDSGLVNGPAGVVGAPGAAIGATSQVPLGGAGTGRGRLPSVAGLPHAQPIGSARPGAEHPALGGEHHAHPCPPTGSSGI